MSTRIKPRAGVGRQRIYEGEKRAAVIAKIAAILRTGTHSKFEHEAICRHTLRQTLCLEGHRWHVADFEASLIVSAALNAIGARRPTWAMGQHEYVIPRENCQRCGEDIDPDDFAKGHRFCSDMCRNSARLYSVEWAWRVEHIARLKLSARAATTRHCRLCGAAFRPFKNRPGDYCSPVCARRARGDLKPPVPCAHCGNEFIPPRADSRFCSIVCKTAGLAAEQPIRTCAHPGCLNEFQPATPTQVYCSTSCAKGASAIARKGIECEDLMPAIPRNW